MVWLFQLTPHGEHGFVRGQLLALLGCQQSRQSQPLARPARRSFLQRPSHEPRLRVLVNERHAPVGQVFNLPYTPAGVRRCFRPRRTLDGVRVSFWAAPRSVLARAVLVLAPFAQRLSTFFRRLCTIWRRRTCAKADFQGGRTHAKLNSIGTLHIAVRIPVKHGARDWHGGCIRWVVSRPKE